VVRHRRIACAAPQSIKRRPLCRGSSPHNPTHGSCHRCCPFILCRSLRHPSMQSARAATSPQLPIEIWELVLDHVAWYLQDKSLHFDRSSLFRCSLVCRAWRATCNFHSCECVSLRSRSALASFCLFLLSSPHLATLVQCLEIVGGKESSVSADDSWVSSVPILLPPLPNLCQLTISDVDLTHQHTTFYKAYAKFKFPFQIFVLTLRNVLFHPPSVPARLALATHSQHLILDSLPRPTSDTRVMADRVSPSNPWLQDVQIWGVSWAEFFQMPWGWILACPNLEYLNVTVEDAETAPNTAPEQVAIGSRICETLEQFRTMLQGVISVCLRNSPDEHLEMKLDVEHFQSAAVSTQVTSNSILKLLSLGFSCQLHTIIIELGSLQESDSSWDVFTPENWLSIDATLSHHYPSLACFDVVFELHLPSAPKYGCINDLARALFPQTTSRGAAHGLFVSDEDLDPTECDGQNCPLHKSATALLSTTETSTSTDQINSSLSLQISL